MAGKSEAMERLRLQVRRIGPHFRMVLVRGEMGTGKELASRALHNASAGADGPFVVCHAAAVEDAAADVTADEWLGNLMNTAQAGTLFIDGIEEMPLAAQSRLLSALKKKTAPRIIASTTEDLLELAVSGRFRQGLYHRIAMVEVTLAPLRERTGDVALLATHFLLRFAMLYGRRVHAISEDAMERMRKHAWPGNVRELENVIRNGVLQCEGHLLRACDLTSMRETRTELIPCTSATPARLQDVIDEHVRRVLKVCAGNKVRAAELLGVSRSTLYRMLESAPSGSGSSAARYTG
jgi:DNA-binding NtrC family response regulator